MNNLNNQTQITIPASYLNVKSKNIVLNDEKIAEQNQNHST